ncbi:MAG TPA: GNAT family protein [Gaiellaceae bacterium]
MIRIRGEKVTLRPIRPDELDVLTEAYRRPDFPIPGRPPPPSKVRRRIERTGRFVSGRLELGVEAEGRLVGDVDARAPANAFPPGVFEIGVSLFDPEDRGKGYGIEATRLITDHLFDAEEADRVQASTAQENTPMRRVLERLGFVEEGILRAFFPAGEGRDDYVLYAMTRADWLARESGPA